MQIEPFQFSYRRPFAVGNFFTIVAAFFLFVAAYGFPRATNGQAAGFHDAPAAASKTKNPLAGKADAAQAGADLYAKKCALCHGAKGQGVGNIPALAKNPTQAATDGAIFWFITKGAVDNGMPAWASLPENQRWQIVTYIKTLGNGKSPAPSAKASADADSAPPAGGPAPTAPFTDYRFEKPGATRKITVADLPPPYATSSAGNGPKVVPRPADAWPKALPGFMVQQFATGLKNPRSIHTAPNGDIFSGGGKGRRNQSFPRNHA